MKKVLSIGCLVLSASYVCANSITKVNYCAQVEQDMLQVGVLELYFAHSVLCRTNIVDGDPHKATIEVQLSDVGIRPEDYATLNGIEGVGYQLALRSKNKQHELVITCYEYYRGPAFAFPEDIKREPVSQLYIT